MLRSLDQAGSRIQAQLREETCAEKNKYSNCARRDILPACDGSE
ncbi:MAG: hypothetical protein ACI9VR_000594 [Cognaticolwellia sp.]|jgi:hypothetical protein